MKIETVYQFLKKSISTEQHDLTSGNLSETLLLLAIPMILELSLESIFAVVDMFFVSKLGQNAIATVGLTESVIMIIYSISIGMSTGAAAIVARRVGEQNFASAAKVASHAIALSFVLSLFIGIFGFAYAKDILSFMGANEEVVKEGTRFTQIMLGFNAPIVFLFLINGIFRGAGNASIAMKSLWIASGVNIVLCPLFIPHLGLEGAAIATVLGRSVGVIYQIIALIRPGHVLTFKPEHFHFEKSILKSVITLSTPASLQYLISTGSWIVLTRLVAETGGTAASAGYQIAFRNFTFFILPAWGISNAAATLIGQNLGAGKVDRAERSVILSLRYNVILMTLVTLVFVAFAKPLVEIFSNEYVVVEKGTEAMQILGSGFIFYGTGMVLSQALNGAGDTKTPTRLNIFCLWLFQIPLAYFMTKSLNLDTKGSTIGFPISYALMTFLSWRIFKAGAWKTRVI